MEEEFNHLDEYFRNVLKDYQKESSENAWKVLDQRLDAAQLHVKPGDKLLKENTLSPIRILLQRPWFRVAIAAAFTLLILFSYALVRQWRFHSMNKEINSMGQGKQQETSSPGQKQTFPFDTAVKDVPFITFPLDEMPITQNKPALIQENMDHQTEYEGSSQSALSKEDPANQYKIPRSVQSQQNKPLLTDNHSNEILNPGQTGFSKQIKETSSSKQDPVATRNDQDNKPALQDNNPVQKSNDEDKHEISEENGNKSSMGRLDDESQSNVVKEPLDAEIIIPNVFTPNGDGKNDYFEIINIDHYSTNQLVIVDRNGRLIFEKTNYNNDWDASGVPSGVYYYLLTYKDNGVNYSKRGVVHIKRN